MNGGQPGKEITLQCGIAREATVFEAKDLVTLTELACAFVDLKVWFFKFWASLLLLLCIFHPEEKPFRFFRNGMHEVKKYFTLLGFACSPLLGNVSGNF